MNDLIAFEFLSRIVEAKTRSHRLLRWCVVHNFPNDSSTLEHGYQPFGTYTATTFTVTFSDDGSGKTATQTVNPFQTIGYVIEEKALSKSGYYPMYYYNESLVTEDSEIKITSDINIKVIWKANS